MKLGRGRDCGGGGLGFIASFSFGPPFPVQADTVVAGFALAFTIITFRSFFPTLDLPVFAGPAGGFSKGRYEVNSMKRLPAAVATPLFGLGASWFLGSRHVRVRMRCRWRGWLIGGTRLLQLTSRFELVLGVGTRWIL